MANVSIVGITKAAIKKLTSWLSENAPKASINEVAELEATKAVPTKPTKPAKVVKEKVAKAPKAEKAPKAAKTTKKVEERELTDAILKGVAKASNYTVSQLKGKMRDWNINTVEQALASYNVPSNVKTYLNTL